MHLAAKAVKREKSIESTCSALFNRPVHPNQATTRSATKHELRTYMDHSKQALKNILQCNFPFLVGGFNPVERYQSNRGANKKCLKTPPTPLKTNMMHETAIFIRKYTFKCWSFHLSYYFFAGVVFILEVKSPDAILQSEVPLDSTNLGSVSVSPLGLASGVAWPTKNNQVCVCTDGMSK